MSIHNPDYRPRTLLAPFEQGPIVSSFLRDTFFGAREFPPTAQVEFDFRRGRRKMAPFVAPLIGGKVMERQGYETRFFTAPRIAPVRALRIPDLEPRLPGETIYSAGTEASRAATLIAEDAIFLDEAITRREEWMCREVLINGKITVTAETGYTQVIDYLNTSSGGAANNHFPITTKWDQANSDPLKDLEAARLDTIKVSGISPNVALFGTNAKDVFIRNESVKELLDLLRFELGSIEPIIDSDSVIRFGRVPGLELYSYAEYFEDDAGQLFPMLPPDLVMLLSTATPNRIVYGAFTQLEDAKAQRFVTYQAPRIPFIYGDEEGGSLFYRLTSRPLPMPADVLGWKIIEALPGGVGPFARTNGDGGEGEPPAQPQPFFEADEGAPQPQLLPEDERSHKTAKIQAGAKLKPGGELGEPGEREPGEENDSYEARTVPELKELASERGVAIRHDWTKSQIIDALEEDDKNR